MVSRRGATQLSLINSLSCPTFAKRPIDFSTASAHSEKTKRSHKKGASRQKNNAAEKSLPPEPQDR
jgi:hypothetical protein